ncbi:MAG: RsmF rRNA methyltransferase first C-terminal domain-containing protein [Fusicatenibacter sp.]|nr:RsmB/NOP family class I SAM-dependent RNA methyltransferase [Fusicatenibacter sp.]
MVQLPVNFLDRMKEMLGEEFEKFLASYEEPRVAGLRVNRMKCSPEEIEKIAGPGIERIPWVENGFFVPEGIRMAQSPLYAAGVFYLQEPSAMTPASRLPIEAGERVLDLCAAPGGKATELAARLGGKGLLVANDISNSRAKALLHNLELFGAGNIFVTNEMPARLAEAFGEFFDKVLVDAPCSGEGMFRKDEAVIGTWTPDRPAYFANLQRDIVANAVRMLRPGGWMMYSTCTFAPEEDEGTISWLLGEFPRMHLMEMEGYEGFSCGNPKWGDGNPELSKCVRIWPHRMNGEGHFLALLRKDGAAIPRKEHTEQPGKNKKTPRGGKKAEHLGGSGIGRQEQKVLDEFLSMVSCKLPEGQLELRGGRVYLVQELPESVKGLHFLRNGLLLGELKKDRFEPSQPFAMALSAESFADCLNLSAQDARTDQFLRGETIPVFDGETKSDKGWKLVCTEGFALGWGKLVQGVLKNKYPAGWRRGQ